MASNNLPLHPCLFTSIFPSKFASCFSMHPSRMTRGFAVSTRQNISVITAAGQKQSHPLEEERVSLNQFFAQAKDLVASDLGPPRWLSPLDCGLPLPDSPLLLFLPGIDGTGLGLITHHQKLGRIFEVMCLHIPPKDRTQFTDLVKLVERTVTSEHDRAHNRPIYLVGESLGACLALAVASQNPDIDLVLILANPTTSFSRSPLQHILPLLQLMPDLSNLALPHLLSSMAADSEKGGGRLLRDLVEPSISYLSEDAFDLVTVIKQVGVYRRSKERDIVSDYIPPSPSEFKALYEKYRWISTVMSPVILSTLANGKIVRGFAGIPSEGPVLYVGYHMFLGADVIPLLAEFFEQNDIHLRGIAHPMIFMKFKQGMLTETMAAFSDDFRLIGSVPVSGKNFFKLLSTGSHVLLYPGGVREAFHRKGEAYKLFWPEESEFVSMAARFGAKIIPFGTVGEDDLSDILLDYEDQMKVPLMKKYIDALSDASGNVRATVEGEEGNQALYMPGIIPKFPGRLYYLFGKPIETEGRKQELRDRKKAQDLYLQVKSEVENCLAYLQEKRESDPYRRLVSRIPYQATYGFKAQVPTFDLD